MFDTHLPTIDAGRPLAILRSEIRLATGCTEVAATAFAAAKAVTTLEAPVKRLAIAVSPSVYKNGALAGVPGTPLRGLAAAGALVALIGCADEGLGLLNAVDAEILSRVRDLLDGGGVTVACDANCRETVYVRAAVAAADATAAVVIQGAHDHITEISRDGVQVFRDATPGNGYDHTTILRSNPVSQLLALVDDIPAADLDFPVEAHALMPRRPLSTSRNHGRGRGRLCSGGSPPAPGPRP